MMFDCRTLLACCDPALYPIRGDAPRTVVVIARKSIGRQGYTRKLHKSNAVTSRPSLVSKHLSLQPLGQDPLCGPQLFIQALSSHFRLHP